MMKKIWKTNCCVLLCLVLFLTGCSGTTATKLKAVEPVKLVEEEVNEAPVVMNNTKKFNEKTLYEYYSENEDTIGWLKIDGIKTDHVVMLGQKNKNYERGRDGQNHYLEYNFNHDASSYGELYIDHRCRITESYMSQNMTVYGHHMRDGTMLAGLDHYKKQSFFEEHPYITFDTLWGTYHFKVFGVFTVNLKVKKDADFDDRQADYVSEEVFLEFMAEVKERSYYDTGVEVKGNDRIITLSTCTYPTGNPSVDNARLVVMGRLCTAEEEAEITAASQQS